MSKVSKTIKIYQKTIKNETTFQYENSQEKSIENYSPKFHTDLKKEPFSIKKNNIFQCESINTKKLIGKIPSNHQ